MKYDEKKAIKKAINFEIKNRADSLIPNSRNFYNVYKYIALAFALFYFVDRYILPESFFAFNSKLTSPILAPITIIFFLLASIFSHYLSKKYEKNSIITKDVWLSKTFMRFFIPYFLGFILLILMVYYGFPNNPVKNLILGLLLISFLGFNAVIVLIFINPTYFLKTIVTGIGTFFLSTFYASFIQFVILGFILPLATVSPPFILKELTAVHYIFLIGSILIFSLIHLDRTYLLTDETFDSIQRLILRFIDSKKILGIINKNHSFNKANIEALEIFLELEKEGNDVKQKALLTYLNKKYQNKQKKIIAIIISVIIFIISSLAQAFIQEWFYHPLRELFYKLF